MKKCELCSEDLKEVYTVTLKLCHNCIVDLDEWLEQRKRTK